MLHLMNNTSPILQIFRLAAMRLMLALLVMVALLASTLTFAAGAQLAPFNDGYFVWDARELSINDARAAIGQFPKLAAHQALIVDRCGLHSVNPRLAALLLDASGTLDEFSSSDVAAIGARIDAFLSALPHVFIWGATRRRQRAKLTRCHPKTRPRPRRQASTHWQKLY